MKKRKTKLSGVLTASIIVSILAAGCGSSDSASYATKSYDSDAYVEEAPAESGALYDRAYENEYEEVVTEDSDSVQAEEITEEKSAKKSNRKLITNMSMSTETKEFDKTVAFLQNRTEELGGYVESFSTSKSTYTDERSASMTLRVPEEKLSDFVNEVAKESNITSQDMHVTDVTLTYADLESHKNALRAEEQQLLNLMEKAETIEDIMSIQDRLTDVRYQLESMESQLRTYDNQISYSTLVVQVREVIEYTEEPVKNPTYFERAKEGFLDNCEAVADFFKELSLLIITHLPALLIFFVIVFVVIILVRRAEKKRKAKLMENGILPPNQGSLSKKQKRTKNTGNSAKDINPTNPIQNKNSMDIKQDTNAMVPEPDKKESVSDSDLNKNQ